MASTINAKNTSTGLVMTPDSSGQLELQTADTTRMTIDVNGNVGVGTSATTYNYQTKNIALYDANSSGISVVGGARLLTFTSQASGGCFVGTRSNDDLKIVTNDTERMRIDTSGNVGINGTPATSGTTAQKFQAIGTGIYVESYTYTGGRTTFWTAGAEGTGSSSYHVFTASNTGVYVAYGATTWSGFSDTRLKNITGTYTNALDGLMKLEPIKFTWKSDATNKPCVGVSAQSVENIVPEAIDRNKIAGSDDDTEYLSVRYTELIPIMIASIQELKAELDTVKAELAELKGAA